MNPQPSRTPKRPIRALTVINPWAALLAAGVKPVENRTWPPHGLVPGVCGPLRQLLDLGLALHDLDESASVVVIAYPVQ